MKTSHAERLGVEQFDPHCLFSPVMVRASYVGSCIGMGSRNRAISARPLQPVIERVFPAAEANEAYRYFSDYSHVGMVDINGD